MTAISSSPRDGGVRIKDIEFAPARWAFLDLEPWYDGFAYAVASERVGMKYDWTAIMLTFALPIGRHSEQRCTCSELVAGALGFTVNPHLITPGDLYHRCLNMNAAYRKGAHSHLV